MSFTSILKYGLFSQGGTISPIPTSGLVAWYGDKVNSGVDRTTLSGGTTITQWDDQSGNGYDMDGIIGSVSYDATLNAIDLTTGGTYNLTHHLFTGDTARTIFIVGQVGDETQVNDLWWMGKSPDNGHAWFLWQQGADAFQLGNDYGYNRFSATIINNNIFLNTSIYNGGGITSELSMRNNGVVLSSTANRYATTNTDAGIAAGCNINGTTVSHRSTSAVKDYEIIAYNRALSTTEIEQVEDYLMDKYFKLLGYEFENQSNDNSGTLGSDYDLKVLDGTTNAEATNYSISNFIKDGYAESNGATGSTTYMPYCLSNMYSIKDTELFKNFTMTCWVQNTDLSYGYYGTPMGFVFYNGNTSDRSWNLLIFRHQPLTGTDKNWYAQFYGGYGTRTINGAVNSAYNTDLTMLTITLNGTTMSFYINDTLIGTDSMPNLSTSTSYYKAWLYLFGIDNYSNNSGIPHNYKGKIWQPKVFNMALTQDQISKLYDDSPN